MTTEPLLKLVGVSKEYPAAADDRSLVVLRDVNLEVVAGETIAVVGPSGSGKSTLLNLMGTLERPSHGQVWLKGRELAKLDEVELARVRNQQIGFVFQAHHLLPQCTVRENVLVPTIVHRAVQEAETPGARGERLLKRVGLGERMAHRPGQLSGGERQRVAVVRALINRPELLLADEPTGALDRASAESLMNLLVELNREEGVTLVVVTHALELAGRLRRRLDLRDGKITGDANV